MIKQPSVENCLEMLGFNPYDTEYNFGVIRKFDKIKAKFDTDSSLKAVVSYIDAIST